MSIFVEEIADEIINAGIDSIPPAGGLIVNEFLDHIPELTVIFENAAGPGLRIHNLFGTKYPEQNFQVAVRSPDQTIARSRALAIYNLFNGTVRNRFLKDTYYISIDPVQAPFLVQRDENDRFVYAVNFTAVKRIS